jgi:predicted dienelactone hydrolase
MHITRGMVAAAAVMVVGAFFGGQASGAGFPPGTAAARLLVSGPFSVQQYQFTLNDRTRATPAHRNFKGSGSRQLEVKIWHPKSPPAPGPLIVYSHGFMGNNAECEYLTRHLASLGYVVAAPNFPATARWVPGGPFMQDVVNQPGDQRLLIDELLRMNATPGNPLAGRIDPGRIGAMGTSLGGLTTTLMAFDPARMEPRLKAAVSIAGLHSMFTPAFFRHRQLPYMVLGATSDIIVPYAQNAAPVAAESPGAILVTIQKGSHVGFIGLSRFLRFLDNPDTLGCYGVNRALRRNPLTAGFEIIGSSQDGIRTEAKPQFCSTNPAPSSMDPRLQQQIATVTITAFFQAHFSSDRNERIAMQRTLTEILPSEVKDISVTIAH